MLNIDWNAPKTPCKTEGCSWPNYHVCIPKGTPDLIPAILHEEAVVVLEKKRKSRANRGAGYNSEQRRAAISQARLNYWSRVHASQVERDEQIVQRYKDGLSMRDLRLEFEVGHGTLVRILHDAQDAGKLIIRSRNHGNIVKQQKNSSVA